MPSNATCGTLSPMASWESVLQPVVDALGGGPPDDFDDHDRADLADIASGAIVPEF